jgi:site-specific DNA recombinase
MDTLINGQEQPQLRCAIYTRKSTEDGLEQEYNTLHAQRDSCEAYINSQKSRGWEIIPTEYDDGGFTGANTKRPAYNRLVADIKANLVDMVVVYKVDRLSRSLADFANIMTMLDNNKAGFVSVTQYFDTSSSIGRMTLNILITFAQFEREMISERIRDKIARSRQKGKYMGGQPVLGYDVVNKKLIINEEEQYQIVKIYEFYSNGKSINEVVDMVNDYGWTTKQWTTQKGKLYGGKKFNKQLLYKILKNPLYIGKVCHYEKIYHGEHEAILPDILFEKVQSLLEKNRATNKTKDQTRTPSMLRGILHCSSCGSKMIVSYTKKKNKKYMYYSCLNMVKNGRSKCKNKSVPTHKMDEFVVKHISNISNDPRFLQQFIEVYSKQRVTEIENITLEQKGLTYKLASFQVERDKLQQENNYLHVDTIISIQNQISTVTNRLEYLNSKKTVLESSDLNAGDITVILNKFFPIWNKLTTDEQNKILDKLFEQIFWDSQTQSLDFNYSPLGIQLLQNKRVFDNAN